MHSPNKAKRTSDENAYIALIKAMPCIVCGKAGPSECHEIEQGFWWLSLPLCADCHRGSINGLHGQKAAWRLRKKTELSCLNEVIRITHCGEAANDDVPPRRGRAPQPAVKRNSPTRRPSKSLPNPYARQV